MPISVSIANHLQKIFFGHFAIFYRKQLSALKRIVMKFQSITSEEEDEDDTPMTQEEALEALLKMKW